MYLSSALEKLGANALTKDQEPDIGMMITNTFPHYNCMLLFIDSCMLVTNETRRSYRLRLIGAIKLAFP